MKKFMMMVAMAFATLTASAQAEAEKLDIARQLLGTGMPASQVALIIKLSLDMVNALHK